jgi:peroxiredoxin
VGFDFGVGREAPLFKLNAHDGSVVALTQYRGEWFPVIVFFEPATPGIEGYLRELAEAADEFWGYRGQLMAIAIADPEALRGLAERVGDVPYPLLADEDGAISKRYGVWNAQEGRVVPVAYIADRAHKLIWAAEGKDGLPPRVADLRAAFRSVVR